MRWRDENAPGKTGRAFRILLKAAHGRGLPAKNPNDQALPSDQTPQSSIPGPAKQKRKRKPRANEPKIDLAGYLERICGVDLTQVVGLNVLSVLLIVSEIGVDVSKWRNAKAFCSW